jgi:chromosome segregation ATPase
MAITELLFSKETLLGVGGALSVGLNGWMAFSRYWISSKAINANDKQQVNMLQFLSDQLREAKIENGSLRDEIEERDETIRQYWKTISETDARLKIIESSQMFLEKQNEALRQQVGELTTSNMNLVKEITQLRTSLRVPR